MKLNFQETIHQRTDEELDRITKDYYFYSAAERAIAQNEITKRGLSPEDLAKYEKKIASSAKNEKAANEKNAKKGLGIPTGWLIVLIALSFVYLMLIVAGISYQNIDLRDTIRREGVVQSVGIFNRTARGMEQQVFYIQLSGTRERLQVFRGSFNYDDLLENIHVGDRLTVFLMPNDQRSEMIQIEKNGNIILHRSEIQNRNRILIYLGILGLLANVYGGYLLKKQAKKRKEEEENENSNHTSAFD